MRPGDDAFKAHQADTLAALARRVLRHQKELFGTVRGMLTLCKGVVKSSFVARRFRESARVIRGCQP
jgi:hypothetical protein